MSILLTSENGYLFRLDMDAIIVAAAMFINLVVLAFIMSKLLYKPVRNFMQKRSERINSQLTQAANDANEAAELKLWYEEKMRAAQRERDDILEEARKKAAETGRQLLADAKREADLIRERAQENVAMEWERAQTAMRVAIIEVSAAMTEKIVSNAINRDTHDGLFAEAMAELEGTTWGS